MEISLLQQPDSAIARVLLNHNEEIITRAGAMISMSNNVKANTTQRRGKISGEGTKAKIDQDFLLLQSFKGTMNHCEVILAPPLLGNIQLYELTKYKLVVQKEAFLACTSNVDLFLGYRRLETSSGKPSLSWLSLAGKGLVFLSSFGAIYEVIVGGEYRVKTEYLVAFENSLELSLMTLKPTGLSKFFGEETSLCCLKGEGKIYCQSHSPYRYGKKLATHLQPLTTY